SDQRYWSMQTSGSEHPSRASELAAGLVAFCTGSVGLTAANSTGGLGCGIGGGSDKAALPLGLRGRRILGPGARSECFASVGDWCS
ncbi:MAG: hypothetical protein WAV38_06670, partial [Xanthobacteraceae bacterium]